MNEFLSENLGETKSYSFPTAALALWVWGVGEILWMLCINLWATLRKIFHIRTGLNGDTFLPPDAMTFLTGSLVQTRKSPTTKGTFVQ